MTKSFPTDFTATPQTPNRKAPKVGIVSLGCPKALVDSERILTRLRAEGYAISGGYDDSDVVLVNTCGFIDSAKQESLEAIGEAIQENGRVIVTGCMGGDPEAIRAVHPKVLAITGAHHYEAVVEAVHEALPPLHDPFTDLVPPQGLRLTPRHYAYLKISEGCHNRCSFCIIPALRGDLVSRPIDQVLREAEKLAAAGVRETLVISQDTSAYGLDLKYAPQEWEGERYETRFHDLCKGLGDLGVWTRLHYVYPYPHIDSILPLMQQDALLPYLDIPFQHASPTVLKAMRRPAHQEKTLERLQDWRRQQPDLVLRSSFIVGFPGETEEDFQYLLEWIREAGLERVGCFKYEAVAGAAANALADPVPEAVKQERYDRFMAAQQEISAARLARFKGRNLTVLVDEVDDKGAIARSYADAPEIDGCVFLNDITDLEPGDMLTVTIDETDDYDMWASPVPIEDAF